MAPVLEGRILDKAADGSYVSKVGLGISEEDQALLDMMKAPERKEQSNTERIIEKGIQVDQLSSGVNEMSKNTQKIENSLKKSTSIFSKGIDFVGSVFQSRASEEEKYHKELVNLVNRLKTTEITIDSNSKILKEGAKSDINVARLLDTLSDTSRDRERILEKILDRQKISMEEASTLLESLDKISLYMNKVNNNVEINLSEIISRNKELIKDKRIDVDERRRLIEEIKVLSKDSGVSSKAIKQLIDLDTQNLDFGKKTTIDLVRLVSKVAEDVQGKKIKSSLEELNNKYKHTILGKKEISTLLTKKVEGGKTFEEIFKEHPEIFAVGKGIKKGFLGTVLQSVGLGSLESIGAVDVISDLLTKKGREEYKEIFKESVKKVPLLGRLLKKGDELKGKGIKGVEKVLGGEEKSLQAKETPQLKEDLTETVGEVKKDTKDLSDSIETSQNVLSDHSESINTANLLFGQKQKKDTILGKLDVFDDALEDAEENILSSSSSFSSGMLALAAKAAILVATFAAAFKFGSWLSDKIDSAMGRGKGGIGDWLYEKMRGTEEEQEKKRKKKQNIEVLKRWQEGGKFSPAVLDLLGDEPEGAKDRLQGLKDSGQIIQVEGKYYTAEEASSMGISESKEGQKGALEVMPEIAEAPAIEKEKVPEIQTQATAIVEQEEPLSAQEKAMAERALEVTGKVQPIFETTKELPPETISPEIARSAQEKAMAERAKQVRQSANVSGGQKSGMGSGRTSYIDDYSIALFNSALFD